jgi:hypothetical protein
MGRRAAIATADVDPCGAFFGEQYPNERFADATIAAGDEGDTIVEIHGF